MEVFGMSVGGLLGAFFCLYAVYVLARELEFIPTLFSVALMRYPYVVIHEVSHLVMGLLMGQGVKKLVLKRTGGTKKGWFAENRPASAGYYLPRRQSFVRFGFIRLGDALTALAGPTLSVCYLMGLVHFVALEHIEAVVVILGVLYIICIIFSRQRLRFILFAGLTGALFFYGGVGADQALLYTVVGLLAWCGAGLIEEIVIIGGYNRHGSDMGNFTKALIHVDWTWLSWILNKFMQAYYLYGLYYIITTLL